jgi:5-methylcytosine-specific restriction endonuclease McrA
MGEKNGMYLNGLSERPYLNWKSWRRIGRLVKERDDYTCQECGKSGGARELVVHHIVPWAITHDNSPENLTTLCQICHPKVDLRTRSGGGD